MSSGESSWFSYLPTWLVQEHKDERARQREMQSDLRQNQRDLMRQKGRLETQQKEMKRAAERHMKAGDMGKAKRQYQNIARIDRDIQQLDNCLNDVTAMNNSAMIAGSQFNMMNATKNMTRAMRSGPGFNQQRQAIQEYSMAKEQRKMTQEMMQDMMYQSDSDEDEEGESINSRAEEMMRRAQDKMNLESGNVPIEGEEFIGLAGAPQVPMQDPAEMVKEGQSPLKNRSKRS